MCEYVLRTGQIFANYDVSFFPLSVKAMLLIIDCKKKITWKKFDHLQNGAVVLSEGKVTLEEKGLLKLEENEEGWEKVNDEVMQLF